MEVAGELLRPWLHCYENNGPDKLAAYRVPVCAAPFECAIPAIQL